MFAFERRSGLFKCKHSNLVLFPVSQCGQNKKSGGKGCQGAELRQKFRNTR